MVERSRYWNPFLETLSRDEMARFQIKRFRKAMAFAKENSPFYREKFAAVGVTPEDIKSLDDLRKLPLTNKEELRTAQEDHEPFLFGKTLATDISELCTLRQTSGTTGRPVYVPDTYWSWQWRVEPWTSMLYMMGFRETDRVFVCFGYNVYVAFWSGHYASEKLGCQVVPGGALDTEGRIQKIREIRATALLSTPTFGLHMAEVAKAMGLDPSRDFTVRKIVCAGEPLPEATRRRLEDLWNADVYNHIGGTETCGWAGMCTEKKDLHVLEPYFLVEFLDRETLSKPIGSGEQGVAVVTPLFFRAFPLIRFNTEDLMVLAKGDCPCGRTSLRIEKTIGRIDDLRKIRGVLFSPLTVEEIIRSKFPQIVEYEIVVTRPSMMDEILLRMEVDPAVATHECESLQHSLQQHLKIKTNLRFEMELCPCGKLPRYTLKAKRFKDLRGLQEDR